jgi:ABC-2 type transport system ATP-binding protein
MDYAVKKNAESALEVRDLVKTYGAHRALDGISITVPAGEVLAILGANGAGKTTFVSAVAGLYVPDYGSVHVCGVDVQHEPSMARRLMAIAPQELGVYLQLSVYRNLRLFGRLVGLSGRRLESRIEEIGAALDLAELMDRRAQHLSGGERRRLHTGMAIIHSAPLLLLDEPTAGVDVHTRNKMLDVVAGLANSGVAVCYTTHYLHEVEALKASVAILESGSVVAQGSVDELIASSGAATTVEARFGGPVPSELAAIGEVDGDPTVVRIAGDDGRVAVTHALRMVGRFADDVLSIDVVHPSLESVYLSICGRRFSSDGDR